MYGGKKTLCFLRQGSLWPGSLIRLKQPTSEPQESACIHFSSNNVYMLSHNSFNHSVATEDMVGLFCEHRILLQVTNTKVDKYQLTAAS